MAIFDHADFDSPVYGTLQHMMARFGVRMYSPAELLWRTSNRSADQIHTRFQTQAGAH